MISSHVRAVCGGLEMICNDLIFTEDSLSVNNFADVSRQDVMLIRVLKRREFTGRHDF